MSSGTTVGALVSCPARDAPALRRQGQETGRHTGTVADLAGFFSARSAGHAPRWLSHCVRRRDGHCSYALARGCIWNHLWNAWSAWLLTRDAEQCSAIAWTQFIIRSWWVVAGCASSCGGGLFSSLLHQTMLREGCITTRAVVHQRSGSAWSYILSAESSSQAAARAQKSVEYATQTSVNSCQAIQKVQKTCASPRAIGNSTDRPAWSGDGTPSQRLLSSGSCVPPLTSDPSYRAHGQHVSYPLLGIVGTGSPRTRLLTSLVKPGVSNPIVPFLFTVEPGAQGAPLNAMPATRFHVAVMSWIISLV